MDEADKTIRCDCGYEVKAADEEQLLRNLQQHGRDAHGIQFAREEALLIVIRSELDKARTK